MRAGIGRSVMTNETTHIVIVINRCHPSRDALNTDLENNAVLQVLNSPVLQNTFRVKLKNVKTWHKKNLYYYQPG